MLVLCPTLVGFVSPGWAFEAPYSGTITGDMTLKIAFSAYSCVTVGLSYLRLKMVSLIISVSWMCIPIWLRILIWPVCRVNTFSHCSSICLRITNRRLVHWYWLDNGCVWKGLIWNCDLLRWLLVRYSVVCSSNYFRFWRKRWHWWF